MTEAAAAGYNSIVLVGKSDLDFIVEYACGKAGIELMKANNDKEVPQDLFIIYGEQCDSDKKTAENRWLRTIIMREKNIK